MNTSDIEKLIMDRLVKEANRELKRSSSKKKGADKEKDLSPAEYKRFLSDMFPSKHASAVAKCAEEEEEEESDGETIGSEDTDESEDEDDDESEDEDDDESDEDAAGPTVMVTMEIVGADKDEYDSSDSDDEDVEDEEEEENDSSSDSSYSPPRTRSGSGRGGGGRINAPQKKKKPSAPIIGTGETETKLLEKLDGIIAAMDGDVSNPMMKEVVRVRDETKRQIKRLDDQKYAKTKKKNTLDFKRLMRGDDPTNDIKFFRDMTVDDQAKVIAQAKEIKEFNYIDKPYSLKLLEADIPASQKSVAMSKMNSLKYMEPGASEYAKTKDWLDQFMKIPFGKYNELPVSMDDGIEKCQEFIASAKAILDSAVYGMGDAKMQILQTVGQWVTNPGSVGNAIAIGGPMGTGKTTLVLQGLAKIMNRPAVMIPLGGAEDGSKLTGHSMTYENSKHGKIIDALIQSRCSNPIIYFDEVDKISQTPKGEEIIGVLMHLIDSSQNTAFHDDYFSEFDFDLSRCLFVFSWNDIDAVNPILRDRMYKIQTKGYEKAEKTIIAGDYLLPSIRKLVNFGDADITIPEETLHYLIEKHCDDEKGVRNLKRCLEVIHTKINLYRLIKPGTKMYEDDIDIDTSFPMTVGIDVVDKLIKKARDDRSLPMGMYV
jgi:ATP-dependent Lon protease